MKIKFTHEISLRVRYSETDQMGYCYYGNYAQYYEVGRVETLRKLGISYKELEADNVMLPVSELNVRYKHPAKYDDLLRIRTTIREMTGARLMFDYTVVNELDKVISEGSTTLVFVSKETMKPIQPPDNFTALVKQHELAD
ncbi:MAG: acyl-CoA thioester hydrolase [Crocinitomicaceae bacterium]|jgi:acyl-CoA thioester hydrolase